MHLPTEADTLALGASLAREIGPGDIIGLRGDLGTGKTTLVRGLLRALGYSEEVRSPTFTLVQEYDTDPPVCHVDLYRLTNEKEVIDLGLRDYMSGHALLIEWIERAGELITPTKLVELRFAATGREAVLT